MDRPTLHFCRRYDQRRAARRRAAAIRHYREALKAKDLAALEAIWSDDVFVNGHGQLRTKADRLAAIRSGASSIDSITHEEAPIVKTHGKTTLVL